MAVSLEVNDLQRDLNQLQSWYHDLEITEDSISRRIRLSDPDGNVIELSELLDPKRLSEKNIYHIATQSELIAGLSEHYYLPPNTEKRFVRARARSAFMSLACNRVAEEVKSAPLVIEMDKNKLSIEEQLLDEADFDSKHPIEQSTYPHVNSPIPRHALTAVGECVEVGGDIPWPSKFVSLDSIVVNPR